MKCGKHDRKGRNHTGKAEVPLENISIVKDGTFVGLSSCDEFTTALGSGQRVLAYSFYVPWQEDKQNR